MQYNIPAFCAHTASFYRDSPAASCLSGRGEGGGIAKIYKI